MDARARGGSCSSVATFAFIILVTQLPALFPIAKYFPAPSITGPLFLLVALLAIFVVLNPPNVVARLMLGAWPTIVVAAALTAAAFAIYPFADSLKVEGRGSDADDALILAGRALWALRNPYLETTYLDNPIAPGPGWALLASPFTVTGLYIVFFPVCLVATIGALRASRFDWVVINQMMLLFASSLVVWYQVAVGSDYLPFILLVLCAVLELHRESTGPLSLTGLVALVGLLSTFRLPFLILPPLIAFSLWASLPCRAVIVASGGLAIGLLFHTAFFLASPTYSPLDLLQANAVAEFSGTGLALAAAACVVAALTMLGHVRSWDWPTHLAIGLGVPWSIVVAVDLASRAGDLANWAIASFLVWPMPFAILTVIARKQ